MTHNTTPIPLRELAINLLQDCFADEIEHLRLRLIRDQQAPRFEAIRGTHPEIWADFQAARSGPHEVLLKNRRKRVEMLTAIAEGVSVNNTSQTDD